ncbi:putative aarF domain-containing protein kinase 2 [Trachymyrmex zeteki]|uniref:Putative aarF domain-containing protein kinase 2 n=1 Tax=Mycetomoellerius zeteki TaxID=64791 RepID=A0A151WHC7_9HYME|nr:putative aarF domain-containing protein kinase 2 [Trachymyrmex zeteki]
MWPINEEKEEEGQKNGFLVDAQEMILVLARIAIVSTVITILLVAYLITRLTHASLFPIILRKGIEFLGPIFVKFGQWVSTRWDVFPRDVCDTLSQLQRNVTPHSWLYTERLLEATYGLSWRNLFVKFDGKEPIGSGCCAQVYKAWIDQSATREPQILHFVDNKALNGSDKLTSASPCTRKLQTVAVKVLHPGIKGQVKRDIAIMRGFCKCATYFIPKLHWLSLIDCVDEFARIMENQVDMRLEASNLVRFSANFSKRRDIVFPYPYTHLTRRRILVESFHEGSPISDYFEYDDAILQRRLARIGIAMVLQMIFKDNFIHCDLHPGNILVEETVVPKASLFNTFWRVITPDYAEHDSRLIILDCGLVVSLNERCRQNLRDVFYSVLMRNVNISTVVSELFSAMIHHRVKQDGSFSSVIISMLVIEGLGRCLDPKVDIFTEILPYVLSSVIYNE